MNQFEAKRILQANVREGSRLAKGDYIRRATAIDKGRFREALRGLKIVEDPYETLGRATTPVFKTISEAEAPGFVDAILHRGFSEGEQARLVHEFGLMQASATVYTFDEDVFRGMCSRSLVDYRGPQNSAGSNRMKNTTATQQFRDNIKFALEQGDVRCMTLAQRAGVLQKIISDAMGAAADYISDYREAEAASRLQMRRHQRACVRCASTYERV